MRLGELCAGYGGLGMAVEEVFGATTAWFSEFDAAPSKILAHHWPDVPNYGDMTKIDWADIEHVDIISGGTPCQDLSHAGRRAGMTEGTRSNLWVQMREAIAIQKPKYVVWENVRGAYSATAASDLEQCPGCMGDTGNGGTVLRALGRVLGDLSDLGFDTEWRGLRASDVGSCHARFRVFVLAYDPSRVGRGEAIQHNGRRPQVNHRSGLSRQSDRDAMRAGPDRRINATATDSIREIGRPIEQGRVTPRPQESPQLKEGRGAGRDSDPHFAAWGEYEASIRRWERTTGRPAPRPTEPTGRNGGQRLSPRFTEWMMGLPDGWVTDPAIGISRNEQLKACGNGVVPQQAAAALRDMLKAFEAKETAV